jgi:hypothetical protein
MYCLHLQCRRISSASRLCSLLAYSSTLKMEVVHASKISECFYQTTRRHIPQDDVRTPKLTRTVAVEDTRTNNRVRRHTQKLKKEFLLNKTYKSSSYLTGNTLHLHYRAQPVNAVWGNSRCLLWEPYGTNRLRCVDRMHSFGMLKRVVNIVTTGL